MDEKQQRPFFIPPWLDSLDIKPHPFRVFCHLLRRAGKDGRCFPSAPSIAAACRISKDTVWPSIKTLEEAGFIKRLPKRFGGSNSYLITPPIGGKDGVIDELPIGGNHGSVDSLQSAENPGYQSAEKVGCQSAEKVGREVIPSKKSTLKKSKREVSPEGIQFAVWFKSTLPEKINLTSNWQQSFAESYDELVRLDKRSPEEIRSVSQWARSENFWKTNFMSPSKLRKRNGDGILWFDVFAEKMKQPSGQTSNGQTVDTKNRPADYETVSRPHRRKEYPQENLELPD